MDPWRKMFMIQKLGPKRPTVVKELCSPELTFLTSRFFVKSNSYFNNQSPYKLLWLTLYFPRIILEVEHGRFGSTFLRSLGETLLPGWQMFHRRLFPIERWLVTRERCGHAYVHTRVLLARAVRANFSNFSKPTVSPYQSNTVILPPFFNPGLSCMECNYFVFFPLIISWKLKMAHELAELNKII